MKEKIVQNYIDAYNDKDVDKMVEKRYEHKEVIKDRTIKKVSLVMMQKGRGDGGE